MGCEQLGLQVLSIEPKVAVAVDTSLMTLAILLLLGLRVLHLEVALVCTLWLCKHSGFRIWVGNVGFVWLVWFQEVAWTPFSSVATPGEVI